MSHDVEITVFGRLAICLYAPFKNCLD